MVLYLDTSALVKRYVAEAESDSVIAKMDEATAIVTALITRTEVAAVASRSTASADATATTSNAGCRKRSATADTAGRGRNAGPTRSGSQR